jgi:hypothetical protein
MAIAGKSSTLVPAMTYHLNKTAFGSWAQMEKNLILFACKGFVLLSLVTIQSKALKHFYY